MAEPVMDSTPQEHSNSKELIGPARGLVETGLKRVGVGKFHGKGFDAEQIAEFRTDGPEGSVFQIRLDPNHGISFYGFKLDKFGSPTARTQAFYIPEEALKWGVGKRYAELNWTDEQLEKHLADRYPDLSPKVLTKMALDLQEGSSRFDEDAYLRAERDWQKKAR